ncbi:uncharacterized protein LOC128679397 [Plodia interpunctella]|uniref:uncharacterized protein LOC128679397 n=1 Tax=Plodia interpunctella TaxID=58824 RepID=UPI002367A2FA|nr:uncharacterized protein LOC128679397 [Plodia interpunctella]
MKMHLKTGAKMSQREKFELINSEVRSFYEYCKEAGMSDEEMDIICRPLTNAVRKASIKRLTRGVLLIIMILAIGFTVSQTETFQWHATALARIVLIKILPVWDWTQLSGVQGKCLMDNTQPQNLESNVVSPDDCIACEAIKSVARISDASYTEVFNHHLYRGAPVIVVDAFYDWSIAQGTLNLTSIITQDERVSNSVPCFILTNIKRGRQPMDLEEIVSKITNTDIPSWFVHFQNCDLVAVKSFRVLAPRPYFLSSYISPAHFNWLLLSKNYDTLRYKRLELDVGLIIMFQLKGSTSVQLKPRFPCEDECSSLIFEVDEGETLVLWNSIWEFEYLPGKDDNVAMITETSWDDS